MDTYELIKGFSTKRLLRMRRMLRLLEEPISSAEAEKLRAINKELRLRTKRRYGKAV